MAGLTTAVYTCHALAKIAPHVEAVILARAKYIPDMHVPFENRWCLTVVRVFALRVFAYPGEALGWC